MLKEDLKHIMIEDLCNRKQISVRASNCCTNNGLYTVYDMILFYENNHSFSNKKIRYAGEKTCKELDDLCKRYIYQPKKEKVFEVDEEVLQIIQELSGDESLVLQTIVNLIVESNENLVHKMRRYWRFSSDVFMSEFCENNFHLPMFWILEQYFKNSMSKEIDILSSSFKIFENNQFPTLEELASKYEITRERVRQIREKSYKDISKFRLEIRSNEDNITQNDVLFYNRNDWSYILETIEEMNIINQESIEIKNCLKEERCTFSVEFALHVIAYLFYDKYCIFSGIDKANKSNAWINTFVIKKEYTEIFDFEKLRCEFSNILMSNESDYMLDIEDYIANSQCWILYDYKKTFGLIKIVRDILLYEFCIYSDKIDGFVKIPTNKERKPIDVVYDILKQAGQPMHLDLIFKEFKKILPEHEYTAPANLRPCLQRNESITYRNRNSVYCLKEWTHIRTGTIRDAIVEFLSKNNVPQSAEQITENIKKDFSKTSISSIRTTMFSDNKNRFSFYKNNLFGLISKEYPNEYEISEFPKTQRKSFSQRMFDFEKFIIENNHFPFSSSNDKNEESLYRWWKLVIKGTTQISEEQKNNVERILIQYSEYETDKGVFEWNLKYNKLKCFILENRRLPSSHEDEKFLYGWLRRAEEDFQNNKLNEEQRQKFINLSKLI